MGRVDATFSVHLEWGRHNLGVASVSARSASLSLATGVQAPV